MKILRMDLLAFGPFTDRRLDFSGGHQGVHVVYGANEAGKSSALRALRDALFGIPNNTADDFLHPKPKLRVGLSLANSAGQQLGFVRRKGNAKTLLADDGVTPLPDEALRPFLGALEREVFQQMFGIDHAALVDGGRQIARFQGDVGKILFTAASGIGDLQKVEAQLKKDAEELFTPTGRDRKRINAALSELDEEKRKARSLQLPSKQWAEHEDKLQEVCAALAEAQEQVQRARRELGRLQRLADAIPLAAKHRELRTQLAELGEVRLVPSDFPGKRLKAASELGAARSAESSASKRLAELEELLRAVDVPAAIAENRQALDLLPQQLGMHRKAQFDLPGLRAQWQQCRGDAGQIVGELRPDLSLAELDPLRLTKKQQIEIQNLGNAYAALAQEVTESQRAIDDVAAQLLAAQDELAALEAPRQRQELKAILARLQSQRDAEEKLAEIRRQHETAAAQAETAQARLPFWQGTLEQLARLPLPSTESIEACQEDLRAAVARLETLSGRIDQTTLAINKLAQQAEQLRLAEGQVPTEADLAHARQLRDRGWQLVKRKLDGRAVDPDEAGIFIAAVKPGTELIAAYELSVLAADAVADRLRREADRIANRASVDADRRSREEELRELVAQQGEAALVQTAVQQRWVSLWSETRIEPRSPKEMKAWIAQQHSIAEQYERICAFQSAIDASQRQIDDCRCELSGCLAAIGEPQGRECESLADLLARADALVDHLEQVDHRRRELTGDIRRHQSQSTKGRTRAEKALAALAEWRGKWSAAVLPLGLPADANPTQANEVLQQLDSLFDKLRDADKLQGRIDGIVSDAEQFQQLVGQLCRDLGVDSAGQPAEDRAALLLGRVREATSAEVRQTALEHEARSRRKELDAALKTINARAAELAAMCQEAGCTSPDQLPDLEARSELARRLQNDCQSVEEALLQLGGGLSIAEFESALAREDADELPAKIEQLQRQADELERRVGDISTEKGAIEQVLRQIDDNADALLAAEKVQGLLARISNDALVYARIRLAAAVLRRAIERFREKNQGPILRQAGQFFAQLTCGRFSGLRVDYDVDGRPLLVGIRTAGNASVLIEAMSDGTADQLYLALRLASLENYARHQEPIPLVVDDVLIQFDNERACSTLGTLAALARHTQVIVFTHHEHLFELARKQVDAQELFIQALD